MALPWVYANAKDVNISSLAKTRTPPTGAGSTLNRFDLSGTCFDHFERALYSHDVLDHPGLLPALQSKSTALDGGTTLYQAIPVTEMAINGPFP
jgi:hypothetical protein